MKSYRKIIVIFIALFSPWTAFPQKGLHEDVDELIVAGKLDEAEELAKVNLEKYPNLPEAMCALACVYRNKARKSYLNVNLDAMGIKEGESGQYPIKGREDVERIFTPAFRYDREAYSKAELLYYKIIETHKEYLNAYFNLLNDFVTMEEFDNYFRVIDLFIGNLGYRRDTPDYLLDLGRKLFEGNYDEEALRLYRIMIARFPKRYEAKSDTGAVYLKKGEIKRARGIFREVFAADKTDAINLDNYILASLLEEDYKDIYGLYRNRAALNPEEYGHLFDLGMTAFLLGKDYQSYFNEFIEKRKSTAKNTENDFWLQNASAILDIENKSAEEKIEYFEPLAIQFKNAGMTSQALIAANIVEKIRPTNAALMIKASVFDHFNYYDKTMQYLKKISDRRKRDPSIIREFDLYFNYGRISYVSGKYKDAARYFTKCIEIDGKSAKANYYLGMSYLNRNKTAEAVEYFTINKNMDDATQMEFINYSIRELDKIEAAN